jgi:dienelactone hydrolase
MLSHKGIHGVYRVRTSSLMVGLLTTCAVSCAASPTVSIIREEWSDTQRKRVIPVKIYHCAASTTAPLPVIIVSHGLGGTREGMEYLGRAWAENGYVSVHLQHPGSDAQVWRGNSQPMTALRAAAANPENAIQRPLDVRFAIDRLTAINAQPGELNHRLDLARIGMAGHSFGAYTTQVIAGERFSVPRARNPMLTDERVKAALILSPFVPREKAPAQLKQLFAAITIPCMHMTGTRDDSPIGDTKAADRRIPFDSIRKQDQYLITFSEGDHGVFSGQRRPGTGSDLDTEYQSLTAQISTRYWDAYLRNNAAGLEWLQSPSGCRKRLGSAGLLEIKSGAADKNKSSVSTSHLPTPGHN